MNVGGRLGLMLAVMILLVGGLAAACGGGDDDDDAGGADDGGSNPAAAEAQPLFVEVGCAECHGENGEGDGVNENTIVAGTPMILGQFRVRVRNGRGSAMPGYTDDQITNEQIELLWTWLSES